MPRIDHHSIHPAAIERKYRPTTMDSCLSNHTSPPIAMHEMRAMRPAKCTMCGHPAKAAKALLFKGKSADTLDSPTPRARQAEQAPPEPDSGCLSGRLIAHSVGYFGRLLGCQLRIALNAPICGPKGSFGARRFGGMVRLSSSGLEIFGCGEEASQWVLRPGLDGVQVLRQPRAYCSP